MNKSKSNAAQRKNEKTRRALNAARARRVGRPQRGYLNDAGTGTTGVWSKPRGSLTELPGDRT